VIAECDITSIQKKNYENLQKVLPNYYGFVNKIAVDMSHGFSIYNNNAFCAVLGAEISTLNSPPASLRGNYYVIAAPGRRCERS
jgi:hypothetical protein